MEARIITTERALKVVRELVVQRIEEWDDCGGPEPDFQDEYDGLKEFLNNLKEKHGQYGTEFDVESDRWDRLPRVCAVFEYTEQKPILIHRGEAGYTELPKDFDVACFNDQRGISEAQWQAMLAGSIFGWDVPSADPANRDEEDGD